MIRISFNRLFEGWLDAGSTGRPMIIPVVIET